jgi:predicted DNA-binding protein with PD1-like motif
MIALRLTPGSDLRSELTRIAKEQHLDAAFVLSAVGSLDLVVLRYAGCESATVLTGDFEILSLAGTLGPDGVHLHMSVSDSTGSVVGGHVAQGCRVRTTAEVVLGVVNGWVFKRQFDPATGFRELAPRKVSES